MCVIKVGLIKAGNVKRTYVFSRGRCSLFDQRGNNRDDLVPIAICRSLLDGGLAWACNSPILRVHLSFQLLPHTHARTHARLPAWALERSLPPLGRFINMH